MSGRKNLYPALSPAAWKFREGRECSVRKPGHVWAECSQTDGLEPGRLPSWEESPLQDLYWSVKKWVRPKDK